MALPDRFSHWTKDMWPLRRSLLSVVPAALRDKEDARVEFRRPWETIRFFSHILESRVVRPHIERSARIHPTAIIDGNVHIGHHVVIHPYAHIVGPVCIADRAEIGDHSLVRSSIIGRHCVIGAMSEVVRSTIGHDTTTHHSFVGDSVVAPWVEITAGDVLTGYNLRGRRIASLFQGTLEPVDGKFGAIIGAHTSIGMHSGVLPGTKIGEYCTIYPGSVVSRDVQNGRTVKTESPLTIYPRQ